MYNVMQNKFPISQILPHFPQKTKARKRMKKRKDGLVYTESIISLTMENLFLPKSSEIVIDYSTDQSS